MDAQPVLHHLQQAESATSDALVPGSARRAWQVVAQVLAPLTPGVAPSAEPLVPASPLVAALRAQGLCTLDEAHALVDLHALANRDSAEPQAGGLSGDLPRETIERATTALHRIVQTASASASTAPLTAEYKRAASASVAGQPTASTSAPTMPTSVPSSVSSSVSSSRASSVASTRPAESANPLPPADTTGSARSSRFVMLFVLVCVITGAVVAALLSGVGRTTAYERGVTAYVAGQRVVARIAFEEAMLADPADPMPLVYLGRLSREEGDLPQARKLLEQAVQRAPDNPLTHRELASALLADGEFELARRFYVRALTLDPTDRPAQGFLGCALSRLGRTDEAARWLERAGPGDWTACAATRPAP